MPTHWYVVLTTLCSAGVQFVLFLRWLHRRMRNDEIVSAFVRDIAAIHLPHYRHAYPGVIPCPQNIYFTPPNSPLRRC
jgi:hypothetical protein